jgi:hypothetical protein
MERQNISAATSRVRTGSRASFTRGGVHRAQISEGAGAGRAAQGGRGRHRTSPDRSSETHLDGAEIDAMIAPALAAQAAADENKRRADWRSVEQNAANFAAGLES